VFCEVTEDEIQVISIRVEILKVGSREWDNLRRRVGVRVILEAVIGIEPMNKGFQS
jgi:hypothetical protein